MMICKLIGHNYQSDLVKIDRESSGIGDKVSSKEVKIYSGIFCPRCGDVIDSKINDEGDA